MQDKVKFGAACLLCVHISTLCMNCQNFIYTQLLTKYIYFIEHRILILIKIELFHQVTFPTILRKTTLSRLWYKPDMLFFTPKVNIIIDFHCPLSSHSPEAAVSTSLFVDLLVDYLNAYGKQQFWNYMNNCIFYHIEQTVWGLFLPTLCTNIHWQLLSAFCSLWCSNCGFILFDISYFYWIPGLILLLHPFCFLWVFRTAKLVFFLIQQLNCSSCITMLLVFTQFWIRTQIITRIFIFWRCL